MKSARSGILLGIEKIDARRLGSEAQQQLRNQAIRLRKKGKPHAEIAEIVGVHPSTVRGWCKIDEREGAAGIRM
ncbi:MAG: helix-turn-helix domain-containing protein, partial [Magnetococcales bacterium]|nr:helix-turn-helix domain-containing protein [Magnetococcales bacterium]